LAYDKLLIVLKDCVGNADFKPIDFIQAAKSLQYIFR